MSRDVGFELRDLREPRVVELRALAARRRRVEQREDARAAAHVDQRPTHAHDWRRWVWAIAMALGLAGSCGAWLWVETAPARALRALPPEQRAALAQRTTETLRSVCDPAPPRAMRAFCHDQAEVALALPECDAACRELARRHWHYATR